MKIIRCVLLILFSLLVSAGKGYAQQDPGKKVFKEAGDEVKADNELRVMFYNVENMFDPAEDSTKSDDEYQPDGMRGWSYSRLKHKQVNVAKVALAVGGWEPPAIIGLCEVENRRVLNGLIYDSPINLRFYTAGL